VSSKDYEFSLDRIGPTGSIPKRVRNQSLFSLEFAKKEANLEKSIPGRSGPDLTSNGYESNAAVPFRAYLTLKTS
jgi:hypothetical protein